MNKMNQVLKEASKTGSVEVVKALLKCGADVHADNDYALRWASDNDHYETVKILLENGADVHAENDESFRWATFNDHLETVKVLEDHIKGESIITSREEYENLLETVKNIDNSND